MLSQKSPLPENIPQFLVNIFDGQIDWDEKISVFNKRIIYEILEHFFIKNSFMTYVMKDSLTWKDIGLRHILISKDDNSNA